MPAGDQPRAHRLPASAVAGRRASSGPSTPDEERADVRSVRFEAKQVELGDDALGHPSGGPLDQQVADAWLLDCS
jgi:hypothetical protein